jgi:hypothetical protein
MFALRQTLRADEGKAEQRATQAGEAEDVKENGSQRVPVGRAATSTTVCSLPFFYKP